jgi:hypothetical protein
VWQVLRGGDERLIALAPRAAALPGAAPQHHGHAEMTLLTLAYGLAGFGYIITATFLPVIARAALPGSAWLDMFWPIFGMGVMVGALLATRLPPGKDFRLLLAGCYFLQALGIAASLWSPSLAGFALGSLMLGIPFTAITFFAMQEVRRLKPATAASFMGLLTATYGVGQILGPPLVAVLLKRTAQCGRGLHGVAGDRGGLTAGGRCHVCVDGQGLPGGPEPLKSGASACCLGALAFAVYSGAM